MSKQITMTLSDRAFAALEAKGSVHEQGASEYLKQFVTVATVVPMNLDLRAEFARTAPQETQVLEQGEMFEKLPSPCEPTTPPKNDESSKLS